MVAIVPRVLNLPSAIVAGLGLRGLSSGLTKGTPIKLGFLDNYETEAQKRLKQVLTYHDDLLNRGFKPTQIDKISINGYRNIIQNNLSPDEWEKTLSGGIPKNALTLKDLKQQAQEALFGASEKKQEFNNYFSKWIGQREAAKTTATQIGAKFQGIPAKLGMDIINYMENPTSKVNPQVKGWADKLQAEYGNLYNNARQAGVDLNFLRNYITHIWKESPAIVEEVYKSAPKTFKFSKQRLIPTYQEGMGLGLTPKFHNPAQIITEYTRRLEESKANVQFINQLKKAGFITDTPQPGFSPINAMGIGKKITNSSLGKQVVSDYYAPAEIAQIINRVFNPEDAGNVGKVADIGHRISSSIQDLTLSGGVPKTPLNSFTIAQVTKDILAGRITSPLTSIFKALSINKSNRFFEENVDTIKKMQQKNIPIHTSFRIENLIDPQSIKNTLGEKVADTWNKTMNHPTFERFMPMLQINLFKDIEKAALKNGKNADEAAEIAATAVKNFYGLTSTANTAQRTKLSQDVIGSIFFAPKYRESMINFWINNLKALKNPLALENQTNTKFVVGAIATYLGMDYLNRQINGHGMIENPGNTQDKLLIPLSDGTTLGIPFLSSIATMPRAFIGMGKNAIEGNFPEVLNQGKTFLSSGIRPPLDVLTNQNYFGQQIYNTDDNALNKTKDIGAYLLGQYNHPYLRAGVETVQGKYPAYQIGFKALEAPLRFYKTESLENSKYFAKKDELQKGLTEEQKKVIDYVTTSQKKGGATTKARADILLKYPYAFNYYKQLQLFSDPSNPLWSRSDTDIKGYLAYQLSEDTTQKAQLRVINPWIPNVQYQLAQRLPEEYKTNLTPSPMQQLTEEQVKIASLYTSLPQGSIQRKALLNSNPWLINYWNANDKFYQQNPVNQTGTLADYLNSVGINPNYTNEKQTTGYSAIKSYSPKWSSSKKISLKPSTFKVKKSKFKSMKVKPLKVKSLKLAKIKYPKIKGITI